MYAFLEKLYRLRPLLLLACIKVGEVSTEASKQAIEYLNKEEEEQKPLCTFRNGFKLYQRDAEIAGVVLSASIACWAILKLCYYLYTAWTQPKHRPIIV